MRGIIMCFPPLQYRIRKIYNFQISTSIIRYIK